MTTQPITLDPQLAALVEKLVEERVERALAERFEEQVDNSWNPSRGATLVVFSGDMDRLIAAFIIATGAAAMGTPVSMFFTFWGLSALRTQAIYKDKPLIEKALSAALAKGPQAMGTSRFNCLGAGPAMFKRLMADHKVASLPELIDLAREMGVRFVACRMSMDMLGLKEEELLDDIDYGGVATFLADASDSKVSLFV